MISIKELFDMAMAISDNVSTDGILMSESDIIDYKIKTPSLINLGLAELNKDIEAYGNRVFEPITLKNNLDDGFKTYEHNANVPLTIKGVGKIYNFEVDTNCTVYLEKLDGTLIEQIDVTTTEYKRFKGYINTDEEVQLRFTGQYYFRVKNVAFFDKKVELDRVPDYDEWVQYPLPDDFISIESIRSDDGYDLQPYSGYKLDGTTILLPWERSYSVNLFYKKRLSTITSFDDVLAIEPELARPLAYFLLGNLMIDENPVISGYAFEKYEFERSLIKDKPANMSCIVDIYGGW